MEIVLGLIINTFFAVKVVSYGIFTAKTENKTGAAGLYAMGLVIFASNILLFIE